jgi:hypothetical protein
MVALIEVAASFSVSICWAPEPSIGIVGLLNTRSFFRCLCPVFLDHYTLRTSGTRCPILILDSWLSSQKHA